MVIILYDVEIGELDNHNLTGSMSPVNSPNTIDGNAVISNNIKPSFEAASSKFSHNPTLSQQFKADTQNKNAIVLPSSLTPEEKKMLEQKQRISKFITGFSATLFFLNIR